MDQRYRARAPKCHSYSTKCPTVAASDLGSHGTGQEGEVGAFDFTTSLVLLATVTFLFLQLPTSYYSPSTAYVGNLGIEGTVKICNK